MGDKYPVLRAKTYRFDGRYKHFTFDEAELDKVVNDNPNGHIAIADTDGEIISVMRAETVLSFKRAEMALLVMSTLLTEGADEKTGV